MQFVRKPCTILCVPTPVRRGAQETQNPKIGGGINSWGHRSQNNGTTPHATHELMDQNSGPHGLGQLAHASHTQPLRCIKRARARGRSISSSWLDPPQLAACRVQQQNHQCTWPPAQSRITACWHAHRVLGEASSLSQHGLPRRHSRYSHISASPLYTRDPSGRHSPPTSSRKRSQSSWVMSEPIDGSRVLGEASPSLSSTSAQ
jgi:hypothetical protein